MSKSETGLKFLNGLLQAKQSEEQILDWIYPTSFQAVDVAVFKGRQILLGKKKKDGELWRFIGGFADPNSESLEEDAVREVLEEAAISVKNMKYVASCTIDDERYKNSPHSIKSAIFTCDYYAGIPYAQDDIDEVRWFWYFSIGREELVPEHRKVLDLLKKNTSIH